MVGFSFNAPLIKPTLAAPTGPWKGTPDRVSAADTAAAVARGLEDAGRHGRIIRSAGASADHPVHPMLPESAYLKALTYALD